MKTEENKRMEALASIIADLKAENMMMTERVHQLVDDYNDVVRQLNGKEKRKDGDSSRQTLSEVMQMRDHCDKLERENEQLKTYIRAIDSFLTNKKIYMPCNTTCPHKPENVVGSVSCQTCSMYLCALYNAQGIVCRKRLSDVKVGFFDANA